MIVLSIYIESPSQFPFKGLLFKSLKLWIHTEILATKIANKICGQNVLKSSQRSRSQTHVYIFHRHNICSVWGSKSRTFTKYPVLKTPNLKLDFLKKILNMESKIWLLIDSYWTKLFWLMTKILMKLCVALWLTATCNFPGWDWSSCFVSLCGRKGIENIVSEVKLQFRSQCLFNYDVLFSCQHMY